MFRSGTAAASGNVDAAVGGQLTEDTAENVRSASVIFIPDRKPCVGIENQGVG